MIAAQILQNTIDGLKTIARVEFGVVDIDGRFVVTTWDGLKACEPQAAAFIKSPADSQEIGEYQFFKIYDESALGYVLVVGGPTAGEDRFTIGRMAAFQLQNLLVAYKEHFDKDNFMKNLLLDNLLLIDIYSRSKKLHIVPDARRVVMVIQGKERRSSGTVDLLKSEIDSDSGDFITAVDENSVVVIKDLAAEDEKEVIEQDAERLLKILDNAGISGMRVAYGTVVGDIRDVSRSFKEAKMAFDVGKIFFADRNVIAYSELGIGRLIYQLPIPLCKMFIKEIFGDTSPTDFDEETLGTIDKFFENSLNVSETSRQLFIHRNTLVYRLDKIQKSTGLDLRVFEDAITFRIALMVVKYMGYMETFGY